MNYNVVRSGPLLTGQSGATASEAQKLLLRTHSRTTVDQVDVTANVTEPHNSFVKEFYGNMGLVSVDNGFSTFCVKLFSHFVLFTYLLNVYKGKIVHLNVLFIGPTLCK